MQHPSIWASWMLPTNTNGDSGTKQLLDAVSNTNQVLKTKPRPSARGHIPFEHEPRLLGWPEGLKLLVYSMLNLENRVLSEEKIRNTSRSSWPPIARAPARSCVHPTPQVAAYATDTVSVSKAMPPASGVPSTRKQYVRPLSHSHNLKNHFDAAFGEMLLIRVPLAPWDSRPFKRLRTSLPGSAPRFCYTQYKV